MRSRALLWLVVAAARAWDFPWSSTEEGWAPEETAPQAESDPFWVDSAPCEADTRPPRNEKRGRALTGNLLRNPDARERTMDGWSVVNGGDGWDATVLLAYAWLYAKNRSKIARVDEETSLLSQTDENPFDPHNGLEITKF